MTTKSFTRRTRRILAVGGTLIVIGFAHVCAAQQAQQDRPFRGGLNPVADQQPPRPVRNDVAQPGDEIVTLRYFRIKKGTFDQFLKASKEGVWPYFEKLGSRVIGMWQVIAPAGVEGATTVSKDYDEVYLSTRYASVEHWKASRETIRHGGNGPDLGEMQSRSRSASEPDAFVPRHFSQRKYGSGWSLFHARTR